jgi:arginase family enzyme
VSTRVVVFPFDLFGSGGSAAGAELVADELREVLADNRRETVATRARAYTRHVRLKEIAFATPDDYRTWRRRGRALARRVFEAGDFLVWLAGNHLGALPVYDEIAGDEDTLVVQLDAHLDIHHFAGCNTEPTHGNFLLHVDGTLPPVLNVGHRELLLTPDYIAEHYRGAFSACDLAADARGVLEQVRGHCRAAKRIFLDIDCDVLDPAYFPAVARPVPFGIAPPVLLALVEAAWSAKVQGVLISEFDPARDQGDRSLSLLVWLLEHLLLKRYEG